MPSRRRRFRARPKAQLQKPPANQEIKAPELRLIGATGEQLGVMSLADAKAKAAEHNSDLIIVAAKSDPPVARILDLGKHMYEKRKKHAKQKTVGRAGEIKGVRIGFQMGDHDTNIRLKQASEFLEAGHKVKLEIRLRGREKGRLAVAENTIQEFIAAIPGGAKREDTISKSPRGLNVLLTR